MNSAMADRFVKRCSIIALLLATAMPVCAFASMLDPDNDFVPPAATSSDDSLKKELDNARQQAGTPVPKAATLSSDTPVTSPVPVPSPIAPNFAPAPVKKNVTTLYKSPEPVNRKEIAHIGNLDDTIIDPLPMNSQPVISKSVTAQAAPIPAAPQVVPYASTNVAPVAPDMNNLLFDNTSSQPKVQTAAPKNAVVEQMPAAPVLPVTDEYIPAPATAKKMAVVSHDEMGTTPPPAMPIPVKNNVPQLAEVPAYIPSVEIRKAPAVAPSAPATPAVASSGFKPAPAKATGEWATRTVMPNKGDKDDTLCVLQNKFDNNLALIIGQNGKGVTLLAIEFGIDMLDVDKNYQTQVELDDTFSQELPAYAANPQKLIVKLGKNPGFFAALQSARALHVTLRGTASTFAL